MPPNADSSVKPRIPFPVPDGAKIESERSCLKPPVGRRIFIQTDTGSVLGIELDKTDNVHTVKKRMQTILNVPAEQSFLVFGGNVLKSDLSEVRNDSPLLLTRELQRSQSTPCFFQPSEVTHEVAMDGGSPIELVGGIRCCSRMKQILKDVVRALECGIEPIAASGGLGGAYYFRNYHGESVAVIKPNDEEPFAPNNPKGFVGKTLGQPGLKRAVRVGETGVREVAAYLLDHGHFAGVPPTVLVKISHRIFHFNANTSVHRDSGKPCLPVAKLASCQEFVPHDYDASDHGTSSFSVSSVHRIGILDVRIFNTDRHAGNILVRKGAALKESQTGWGCVNEILEIIPIDHGLCLPEGLEDPYFEWLHWPQSSVPFSEEELDYIANLDEMKDADMLRSELPMLREACHRMLILSTNVLKKAAASGLCLAEIGEIMTKDAIEEASQFELICFQAKRALRAASFTEDEFSELSLGELSDDLLEQFEMDEDEQSDDDKEGFEQEEIHSTVPILTLSNGASWASSRGSWRERQQANVLSPLDEDGLSPIQKVDNNKPPPVVSAGYACPSTTNGQTFDNPRMKQDLQTFRSTNNNRRASTSSSFNTSFQPPGPMSYRSMSLRHNKQRYGKYSERRKGFFKDAPLTPAPKMSGNGFSCGNSPSQFSLGDMSNEEWSCFVSCFNGILDEMLAARCTQSLNCRQRLGTSCQF